MKTFCTTNTRGGCGKTTDAVHLAIAGATLGHRILAVDLDPQAHLTVSLLPDAPSPDTCIDAALMIKGPVVEPTPTAIPGLDIIPSRIELADIMDTGSLNRAGWEARLTRFLENFEDQYDFVVIDTPATYGRFHTLAFHASDGYLVSMRPEAFSLLGFAESVGQVEDLKRDIRTSNPLFVGPVFAGYILNGVPRAKRLAVERIRAEIGEEYLRDGFEVPQDIAFDECRWASGKTKSIFDLTGATDLQNIFISAFKNLAIRLNNLETVEA